MKTGTTAHNTGVHIISANDKRSDRILRRRITDIQSAIVAIDNQLWPLVEHVLHRYLGLAVFGNFADIFVQPCL